MHPGNLDSGAPRYQPWPRAAQSIQLQARLSHCLVSFICLRSSTWPHLDSQASSGLLGIFWGQEHWLLGAQLCSPVAPGALTPSITLQVTPQQATVRCLLHLQPCSRYRPFPWEGTQSTRLLTLALWLQCRISGSFPPLHPSHILTAFCSLGRTEQGPVPEPRRPPPGDQLPVCA